MFLAFELSEREWKLGFTRGFGERMVERTIPARDQRALLNAIAWARTRLGLPADARVRSCYEAGREAFWLHRFLEREGVENLVVDSASIEVNRKKRRAKSDRLDVRGLLDLLLRDCAGSQKRVWSVLRVPSAEEEDARQLHRELIQLKQDRTRVVNRIRGLLATVGARAGSIRELRVQLSDVRQWDDTPLPPALRARVARALDDHDRLCSRIRELEALRRETLRDQTSEALEKVRALDTLRGIGTASAWMLVMEFFWRDFDNRKQVGKAAGYAPTPFQSGNQNREQGIGKDGNVRVRAVMGELAWAWVKHQPDSALTRWFQRRFGDAGPRARRIGIVALGRKLLIELWRFLESGELPKGAVLKPAVRIR